MEIDVYGASGHAKVIIEILEENGIKINRIVDDNNSLTALYGYKVYKEVISTNLVLAIGNNKIRYFLANSLKVNTFPKVIHPKAILSKRAILQSGTVVMAGATINADASIGQHCIINTNASVDHDCIISDYVHISPNAALAGNVEVNEGTHVGIGASIIQGVKIGKWCTIGAGTVVIKDVPDYAVVVGNPGKIIKYNK